MKASEIASNVEESIYTVVSLLLEENVVSYEDVQKISLKGSKTMSLPFYHHLSKEEIEAFKKSN